MVSLILRRHFKTEYMSNTYLKVNIERLMRKVLEVGEELMKHDCPFLNLKKEF
jgi:hypothetical protein